MSRREKVVDDLALVDVRFAPAGHGAPTVLGHQASTAAEPVQCQRIRTGRC
ncbi:hypothetical protein I545_5325 [Mycobacterium kansasii 662]|uniref:Uncharacterized protein n=2 Tax=Mycobacterium kansasii TaxID=1768 RepID=A0A1V3WGP6_MYCKA|nr:hypothetical protein I545_5325 [Mycobacterium kansasii 662]OOK65606.1 hypothetical protein BZL30_8634 [Mycobacterium kansasii]